ncbi:MAG: glycosyltransferase family 39 protein [Chloroflexi bacterium]|nr:glycosyltransferase family 39 protein [Chloroflexota bacterium]
MSAAISRMPAKRLSTGAALQAWLGRRWVQYVLLGLTAALPRIYRLGYRELIGDEAFSYLFAIKPLGQIIPTLLATEDTHSPLHYLLLHCWTKVFGVSEAAMRVPAVILGIILVLLVARLGEELGGRRVSLIAGALTAVSESQVWLSQSVRNQYEMALVFSMLSILCLLRALRSGSWRWWTAYAVLCALTVYSHYYGLFALLAQAAMMASERAYRRQLGKWLLGVLGAVLLFAPWAVVYYQRVASLWSSRFASTEVNLAEHLATIGKELTVGPGLPFASGRWVFIVALLLAAVGVWRLRRERRSLAVLLTSWLVLAALITYVVRLNREIFNTYYIAVAAPAWWLLAALGIDALLARTKGIYPLLGKAGLAALAAANIVSLGYHYYDPAAVGNRGYREMAAYIARYKMPQDIFIANYPDPCFDYYLRDVAMPRTMQPAESAGDTEKTGAALRELADKYKRLWFAPSGGSNWDPASVAETWLTGNLMQLEDAEMGALRLQAYMKFDTFTRKDGTRESIAGQLRLQGAVVLVNGRIPAMSDGYIILPAGAQVQVKLIWEALGPPSRNYTVFVHVLGQGNLLLAQHDGWPLNGERPTLTWTAGEVLEDEHTFTVPSELAGSTAHLVVGLYTSDTQERQLWSDGQDILELAQVQFR